MAAEKRPPVEVDDLLVLDECIRALRERAFDNRQNDMRQHVIYEELYRLYRPLEKAVRYVASIEARSAFEKRTRTVRRG